LAGGWLINRFGRKRMLVAGGQLVTVALFAVFIVYSFSPKSMHLLVLLIVLFTLGYSATIGVIPLIYLGELMQNLSQVNIIYWFFALVGMLSSDIMLAQMGVGKSFFLYGLISYICVYLLSGEMVESHNKTRKELNSEYLYENKEEGALREYKRMEIGSAEGNSLIDAVET
jgi:MFS family permease